jgi:hypothetical protein
MSVEVLVKVLAELLTEVLAKRQAAFYYRKLMEVLTKVSRFASGSVCISVTGDVFRSGIVSEMTTNKQNSLFLIY